MSNTSKKVGSLMWIIGHYKWCASRVWNQYPDLADAYFMYDHYMQQAKKYEDKLIELLT